MNPANTAVGQTILVVEDERVVAMDLQCSLEELSYRVPETAASSDEAIRIAEAHAPTLALMDINIEGDLDGVETAEILRARFGMGVVFLTAYTDDATVERAKKAGAHGFLAKPVRDADLRSTVEIALYKSAIERELAAANEELQAFGHSISHDLRAPLRHLRNFTASLTRRAGESLDEESRGDLQRIRDCESRMTLLIDDLYALSTVRSEDMNRVPTDLTATAQQVVEELRSSDPGREVAVSLAAELHAVADPGLIRILLDNLIGNAWKFTAKVADARIEVGAESRSGRSVFFVRDNGAGFDMAYVDKLFRPFERLHAARDFPGSGIGLATVRRIVERHDGRVWGESGGEGATFYFTLPSPEPDETLAAP